ncbi:hypothetical protein V9T40_005681 [Parthenolecanium corni]|uniref:PDZ domain-containing protein n=1 Tax=Parthenolecanium corni TaxID=536013 RepID=A0AAN9TX32_9HEMI
MTEEITLIRACDKIPWGFRLMGGVDFGSPLTILRLTANSVAETRGLKAGDIITEIGDVKTKNLTHAEAQRHIIESKNHLRLQVLRGSYPDVARAVTPVRGLVSHSDEEQHEPTEEEIEEMLLENAEVIEEKGKSVLGVNFRRFIPKCDFIKDSAVFHVLQEEQVHKELSEKEQLAKCPNKRFSTFLLHPDRPVPEPKNKKKEDEHLERKETNTPNIELQESPTKPNTNESKQICSSPIIITTTQYEDDQDNTSNTICTIESSDKEQNSGVETEAKKLLNENQTIITASNEVQIVEITDNDSNSSDFENQLNQIKNTLTMLGELPTLIQSQLATVQTQINQLLQLKDGQTNANTTVVITTNNEDEQTENDDSLLKEANFDPQDSIQETADSILDEEQAEWTENENETQAEETTEETEITEDNETEEEKQPVENDLSETPEDEDAEERELHRRRICPLTPLPRPVVLPGGRIWRKPKDAYNEEFIAETLINQAEVIVGSTLGVNFRKYEPPKLDLSNSAVYKLIHNLEDKKGGLEERDTVPALQDYYQPPISAKHFYLASLADKVHEVSDVSEKSKIN